jgi:hypothetical protein
MRWRDPTRAEEGWPIKGTAKQLHGWLGYFTKADVMVKGQRGDAVFSLTRVLTIKWTHIATEHSGCLPSAGGGEKKITVWMRGGLERKSMDEVRPNGVPNAVSA